MIDSYIITNEFNRSVNEPTLYVKSVQQGNMLNLCVYVDDKIYTGNLMLEELRTVMKNKLEMIDLGLMKYFLSLEATRTYQGIFICQHKYAIDILHRYRMDKCKPAKPPSL